jgi:hypothetical protein
VATASSAASKLSTVLLHELVEPTQPKDALADGAGRILPVRVLVHGKPALIAAAVQPI